MAGRIYSNDFKVQAVKRVIEDGIRKNYGANASLLLILCILWLLKLPCYSLNM